MKYKYLTHAILIFALVWAVLPVVHAGARLPADGQQMQGASLIVQFGDGHYATYCISFAEESISGLELLMRSGLAVATWGTAVCRIEREGCNYPAERCFCQCLAPPCRFWSYWQWSDGRWVYSQVGAGYHPVHDGEAYAWVWGDGQTPPALVPSEALCSKTIKGPDTPVPLPGDAATPQAAEKSTATLSPASNPAPSRSQGAPVAQYAAFAVISGILLGSFAWLRLRHREQ